IRHHILENLNWQLVRLWSTDYWIDPTRALNHVHERLEELLKIDRTQQGTDSSESEMESEIVEESTPPQSSENGVSQSSAAPQVSDSYGFELSAGQFYDD